MRGRPPEVNFEDIEEVFRRTYTDTRRFCKVFFPDRFARPFDPLHDDIFDVVDNVESQMKAIAAPRGIGKTSIGTLAKPAKHVLFAENAQEKMLQDAPTSSFVVVVSATADSAIEQTENLKYKMMSNPIIKKIFGEIKTKEWSKQRWVVEIPGDPPHNVCIMPRGAGQQIRGKLYRDSRPDLIVVDDLEDSEEVQSEDQRRKLKKWFYSDLMGAVDQGRDDWEIFVVGTVLHEDSLLVNLLESNNWYSTRLEICDDDFNSHAPHYMSSEECKRKYEQFKEDGEADEFSREYRNLPIPPGDKRFKEEFFKYYQDQDITEEELNADPNVESFVLIDPARTTKETSAETALVGCSVNVRSQAIYFRRIEHGHFEIKESINKAITMALTINASAIGIEVTGLNEFALYPYKNELSIRDLPYEVVDLHARAGRNEKGKIERIGNLAPLYQNGQIYHNRNECDPLEQQLGSFPRARRWDVMDAAAYVLQMLEDHEQYMRPSVNEFSEDREDIEAEYRMLEDSYEQPLDNFRLV